MTTASRRRHFAAASMVIVLAGLSIATVMALRADTGADDPASTVADPKWERAPLELPKDSYSVYLFQKVSGFHPTASGWLTETYNGLDIAPERLSEQETERDRCPDKTSAKRTTGRATNDALADQALAMSFAGLPGKPLTLETRTCDGTARFARWDFMFNIVGSHSYWIERDLATSYVTWSASRSRWQPLQIGDLSGAAADPYIGTSGKVLVGCFAAVRDGVSGVTTSVASMSAPTEFCIEVLTAIIEGD